MANWINLLDLIYPIGSVYISNSSISPASLIGGSWTQVIGQFIRGNNSNGSGAATTHTHVLGNSCGAQIDMGWNNGQSAYVIVHTPTDNINFTPMHKRYFNISGGDATEDFHRAVRLIGSTDGENSNPAYKDFYIWYRTA